ncbi:MAG TPA: hypothetical protein VM285_05810 [Polyangia bacterium]|nr:hypothetical protein [Polyangia bacterium]
MAAANETKNGRAATLRGLTLAVLVLGSLWGVAEVVLNDTIKAVEFPFRAGALVGFGMLVMGALLGFARRPLALLAIPLVAVSIKQLVVPIAGATVLCKANSCIAVLLQATVLAGAAGFALEAIQRRSAARVAAGAGAGLLSAVPFYFVGLAVAPCNYLLSFDRAGGFAAFMVQEGLVWAAFAAVLFPAGYWIGVRVREPLGALEARRPAVYCGTALGVTVCCWIGAALAIAIGA